MIYDRFQTDLKTRRIIVQRNDNFNRYYLIYLYLKYYGHNILDILIYSKIHVFTITYTIKIYKWYV